MRGIAENQPVPVYSLKGITSIPTAATLPLPQPWGEFIKKWTTAEVKKLGRFTVDVPNTVRKDDDVVIRFYTPGTLKGLRLINDLSDFKIKTVTDKTEVTIDLKALKLAAEKLLDDEEITLEVKYRQR